MKNKYKKLPKIKNKKYVLAKNRLLREVDSAFSLFDDGMDGSSITDELYSAVEEVINKYF